MRQNTTPFRPALTEEPLSLGGLSRHEYRATFQSRLSEVELNPARDSMLALTKGKSWVEAGPFYDHAARYGLGMLSQSAIEFIKDLTAPRGHRLVSVFTGLGYAEAQLAAQGMDVVGFDRVVSPSRWLERVYKGPAGQKMSRFADRALFLSFPDRNEGDSYPAAVVRNYRAAEGNLVFVLTEEREHLHAFGCDKAFFDAFQGARCLEVLSLPRWPNLELLFTARLQHSTFKPVLKTYLFDR